MKKDDIKEVASDAMEEDNLEATSNVAQEEDIEELELKLEEAENKYRRALADYHNLQKRVQEEKTDWIRAANKELLLRMLPVLDTLMMANKHVEDAGLKVSINQFLDTLKAEGVTKIKTVGEEFNPHLMDCVQTVDGDENKVIEEARPGYMIYDKVLRPAQVIVGKK